MASSALLAGSDGLPTPRRYWSILAVSLGTAVVVIDTTIVIVALPTAARELGVSDAAAIGLVAVYQFVLLTMLLPFAALGDRIGHRRLYQAGQGLFLAASLLCFLAPGLPLLLAARALQAAGAAAALSVGMALLRSIYPAASLGRGIGINGVIVAVGAALAPSIGGLLVATASWRWVFVATTPLLLASLALSRVLPPPDTLRTGYDWRGALFYVLTFGALALALDLAAYGGGLILCAALLAGTAFAAAAFVRREARQAHPILPVDLLARPVFSLSAAAALAAFVGSMTMTLSLPFLLEELIGRRPAEIGALMMAWPLAMMVSAPVAGALADRLPHGTLGAFGMILSTGAYLLLAAAPADAAPAGLALRIALCGLGMGFFIAPNARQIVGAAPRTRTAAAGGLISTTRILGQALGAALVALLLQTGLGQGAAPAVAAAGFALLSALLSLGHFTPAARRARAGQPERGNVIDAEDCISC
jgi:DHA2 family multidrug resistance protein-like MFS transporter